MMADTLVLNSTMVKRQIFDGQTTVRVSFRDWVRAQCTYCKLWNYRKAGASINTISCPLANQNDPDILSDMIVYDLERGEVLPNCIMEKIQAADLRGSPVGLASDEPHYT